MTAQTGRINDKNTQFWLDNSSGTLTNLSAYANSVGAVGLNRQTVDVTAFSDAVQNFLSTRPTAPLVITFPNDTVVITHLSALNPDTPLSLGIYYGVRHAWEAGEPTFGLSSSATSGYIFLGFTVSGGVITANFEVFGPTAPAWGTSAIT
jgi:hypothetical protein